jgi:putative endonuclease
MERRWRPKHYRSGEIDLVARDGGEIVFVEVKTRRGIDFGLPEEAVTAAKRDRLRRTAQAFLEERSLTDVPWRIDVITVLPPAGGARARLRHIRSAVGEVG